MLWTGETLRVQPYSAPAGPHRGAGRDMVAVAGLSLPRLSMKSSTSRGVVQAQSASQSLGIHGCCLNQSPIVQRPFCSLNPVRPVRGLPKVLYPYEYSYEHDHRRAGQP